MTSLKLKETQTSLSFLGPSIAIRNTGQTLKNLIQIAFSLKTAENVIHARTFHFLVVRGIALATKWRCLR